MDFFFVIEKIYNDFRVKYHLISDVEYKYIMQAKYEAKIPFSTNVYTVTYKTISSVMKDVYYGTGYEILKLKKNGN